ncbi:MAG: cysteine dioxygenase family protein [Desulfobacterales bacterium]|nr:cysteine dioxygenase family protein [Desulfobacterales bacterium]
MTLSSKIPAKLLSKCLRWSKALGEFTDNETQISFIRKELPLLLTDKVFFVGILENIIKGDTYPDIRKATMFDNEVLLYIDPEHRFSMRLFLWEPGEFTPIHDHNSWGVIGPVTGELEVVKYKRENNGSSEEYANLTEIDRFKLQPGETDFTMPLNDGIHKTGNEGQYATVSVGIYGRSLKRPYINGFNIRNNQVYKIYSPKLKKKNLASQALEIF